MASDDLELDGDIDGEDGGEGAPKSKKMMIIIIIGVVLLLIVGVVGGLFASGFFDDEAGQTDTEQTADGDDEAAAVEKESAELMYWPLEPAFVLNFEGKSKARYMQIGIEVVMTNAKASAAVKKHSPVIRNEIVLLLSGQKYEEMVTPEGKEQLRAELIEVINGILKQRRVRKGITNLYFTSFVMQ